MSTANSQPASSAAASQNLSNALGSIGDTSTESPTPTSSQEQSSNGGSQATTASSAAGTNTITDAPNLSTGSSAAVSSLAGAPSLTSSDIPQLTGLPTLSGYYSYPPPTVPPTQNAPYMQKDNLPENFVFIIVGACIAFVALVIIGWRTLTAWSINRRFRRGEGTVSRGKASYTQLADFKQKPAAASNHDMKDLGNLPRNFSSVPSLFFSPTAEVAKQSMRPASGMVDSSYAHLPAGHYRDASRT